MSEHLSIDNEYGICRYLLYAYRLAIDFSPLSFSHQFGYSIQSRGGVFACDSWHEWWFYFMCKIRFVRERVRVCIEYLQLACIELRAKKFRFPHRPHRHQRATKPTNIVSHPPWCLHVCTVICARTYHTHDKTKEKGKGKEDGDNHIYYTHYMQAHCGHRSPPKTYTLTRRDFEIEKFEIVFVLGQWHNT